jgi:DNA-binding protein H-NS
MSINLEKMSLPDQIQLQKDLVVSIKQRQKTERVFLRKQMEELAKQSGFTFDEVIFASKVRKKTKVDPKYANPDDKEQTWTGRGRRPKWVEAALADGKDLDDMLI